MAQRDFRNEILVAQIPESAADTYKDLLYQQEPDRELFMDIYVPQSALEPVPAGIFLHGDTADPNVVRDAKDWGQFRGWSQLLVSEGIGAVTFNRRSTHLMSRWEEAKSDIEAALDFVKLNADKYGIDAARVALFAFSAGGLWAIPALQAYGQGVRCLVLYYPRLGYRGLTQQEQEWLRGKGVEPQSLEPFLGSNQIKAVKSVPPILLVQAAREHPSLIESARIFIQEANRRHLPIHVEYHEDGQHGFDVRDENDRSRELIQQTLAFLREHLRP